jgi:nucleoside-diphosphate-sugar epimerase
MRIFVTGATGFVGSAIVSELKDAGHQVLGLARSDQGAASLIALGAEVLRGSLEDLDSLRNGAAGSDGVIHTAFIHDFSNYGASAEADRLAIETLGAALAGSDRPLVVTSGILMLRRKSSFATEQDDTDPRSPRKSEAAGLRLASEGVRVSLVRLPLVHGDDDHGFVPHLFAIAREKGISAYVGDGLNHWPAVHRLDAARLYRLALEKGSTGSRYHSVADEGVVFRDIARVIGRHLNVPLVSKSSEEAADHFGWMSRFAGIDCPASSVETQEQLGWRPTRPSMIADIGRRSYFEAGTEAAIEAASMAGGK